MSDSAKQSETVKVGILGDKYVGKTYLAHKITGINYQGYEETTTVSQLKPQHSDQTNKFVYVDNPVLDNQSIVNFGTVYQYDILVFLFKDCDSFTKLFEFFDTIKQTLSKKQNHHAKQYWSHPKKIIAVYSSFESEIEVQVEKLFTILIEQINQFCKQAIFQPFILEKQLANWKDLKFLIQKPPIITFNHKVQQMLTEANSTTLQKQQSQKQSQSNKQIEQIKKQQIDQEEERAELLSEQQSEVIVINHQAQQIRNVQVTEITKQIETASAQLISEEQKSKQQIKSENQKQDQNIFKSENVQKQVQVQKQETTQKEIFQIEVDNTLCHTEQIKINTIIAKIQHLDEVIAKKEDQRKEEILKKIRDSFCGSFVKVEQNRKSNLEYSDYLNPIIKIQEVKVQEKQQGLQLNFQKSENQQDSKISLQLKDQNIGINQKLRNQKEMQEELQNEVKNQQIRQSLTREIAQKENQNLNVIRENKRQPQSQFSKIKKAQKQKKLKQQPRNCECKII